MQQNTATTPKVFCNFKDHQNQLIQAICIRGDCDNQSALCFKCLLPFHRLCVDHLILLDDLPTKLDKILNESGMIDQIFESLISQLREIQLFYQQSFKSIHLYQEIQHITNMNGVGQIFRKKQEIDLESIQIGSQLITKLIKEYLSSFKPNELNQQELKEREDLREQSIIILNDLALEKQIGSKQTKLDGHQIDEDGSLDQLKQSQQAQESEVNACGIDKEKELIQEGLALCYLGQYQDAIVYCEKALEINPNSYEALNNKGAALNNLGQYQDAIVYCDKALEINPNSYETLNTKGAALNNLGQYQDAIVYCDKALEINPNSEEVLNIKGVALCYLGQYQDAIVYCDKALEINPNSYETLNTKGAALNNLGQYQDAIVYCDKALEINPNSYVTLNTKGVALCYLGQYQDAIVYCDKALEINPNSYVTLNIKGVALCYLGQYQDAIVYCDKALEINPNSYETLNTKGAALLGCHCVL